MYQINFEDEKRTVNQSRILDKNVVAEIIFGLDLMNNIVEHHPLPKNQCCVVFTLHFYHNSTPQSRKSNIDFGGEVF